MSTHTYWLPEPEDHDYPAAESYLTLIEDEHNVNDVIAKLRAAPITHFKAKDIFRASKLSMLGVSNSHVIVNLKKIHDRVHLSPILLVRDPSQACVVIADGYHRLCAVYHYNEDAMIPCKLV